MFSFHFAEPARPCVHFHPIPRFEQGAVNEGIISDLAADIIQGVCQKLFEGSVHPNYKKSSERNLDMHTLFFPFFFALPNIFAPNDFHPFFRRASIPERYFAEIFVSSRSQAVTLKLLFLSGHSRFFKLHTLCLKNRMK